MLNGDPYYNNTLITTGDTYTFILEDNVGNETGITFTIDTTNPLVTGNYPISGSNITVTNNIVFDRVGSDNDSILEYTLHVTGTDIYNITTYDTGHTIYTMNNGSDYSRYVTATDRAGNTGTSQTFPFQITTPLS